MEITEGMSDLEKEFIKDELVRKIKDSAEKSFGNVPNYINSLLEEYSEDVVEVISWKTLLKKFIGVNISSDLEVNKKRPNKRFDWSFANKPIYKCNIFFGADSSGSVSDEELTRAWAELDIVKKSGGNLYYASWDAECEDPLKIKTHKFKGARTKSGGKMCATLYRNI